MNAASGRENGLLANFRRLDGSQATAIRIPRSRNGISPSDTHDIPHERRNRLTHHTNYQRSHSTFHVSSRRCPKAYAFTLFGGDGRSTIPCRSCRPSALDTRGLPRNTSQPALASCVHAPPTHQRLVRPPADRRLLQRCSSTESIVFLDPGSSGVPLSVDPDQTQPLYVSRVLFIHCRPAPHKNAQSTSGSIPPVGTIRRT